MALHQGVFLSEASDLKWRHTLAPSRQGVAPVGGAVIFFNQSTKRERVIRFLSWVSLADASCSETTYLCAQSDTPIAKKFGTAGNSFFLGSTELTKWLCPTYANSSKLTP